MPVHQSLDRTSFRIHSIGIRTANVEREGLNVTRKLYTGPVINVSFDGSICEHAGECVRGMASVFDTGKRPWINPDAADTDVLANQLRDVIARCPSGALRVEVHSKETRDVSQ
jgi:uncharacterized Fe-S cluster protein YjdI